MNRLNQNDLLFKSPENQTSYWEVIFAKANKELIKGKVRSIAYGTYYYGSVGSCDLEQKEHKNSSIFNTIKF